MKTLLRIMLFLCLSLPGHCDCQRECLICSQKLFLQKTFNRLVCIDECERRVATALIWDACDKAIVNSLTQDQDGGLLRLESEEVTLPKDWKDGTIYTALLKHLTDVVKASGGSIREEDQKMSQTPMDYLEEQDVQESSNSNGENYEIFLGNHNLSKRFGGFLKGKYGYKKLLYPGKSLYKRYGGFIGVRKSARKWNNQKRFSEFLKQYLGMSTRSSEYDSLSTDITVQNDI
ncbi:prepronociceptin-like [Erpetoichthys calabaricus]|uniref:Prepronociceptin b n=1 Tax=Erpetoichthys calabaricus TaxID=27687 RepID=A0A8C4RSM3_ERPCA|nr:prepronociceptin-like [Erpetoichthys calabaricus]